MIKKSDLVAIFGHLKNGKRLFLHSKDKSNFIVRGLNAKSLKIEKCLCFKCNNELTQPYDKAWEKFSHFVRNEIHSFGPGTFVRADRIYPLSSNKELQNVQLYFVKLFGCLINQGQIPIYLKPFAKALLDGKFNRDVFIKLGYVPRADRIVGVAGLATIEEDKSGQVVGAQWFYELNSFAVNIIYATDPNFWENTKGAWHPKFGTGRLLVHDFSKNVREADH